MLHFPGAALANGGCMHRSRRNRFAVKGFRFDEVQGIAKFSLYLPGGRGKTRVRKTIEAANLEDALLRFAAFRARVLGGAEAPRADLTLRVYVETYFEDVVAGLSESTIRGYADVIRKHLLPTFGTCRLREITTPLVRMFETKLKRAGYSLASVNGFVNVLLLLLHRAVDQFGVIEEFPLKQRLKRKKPATLALELTDDERRAFFTAFDDETAFHRDLAERRVFGEAKTCDRYATPRRFGASIRPDSDAAGNAFVSFRYMKLLFVVAVETGLRRGDLLGLTWRDIDFERKWVHIVMRKTKLPVTVPLSIACYDALVEWKRRAENSARVFIDEAGQAISDTRVKRSFDRAKRLAGITRRFRFHDLRHTFGSRLASSNVSIPIISRAMGHASITTTMRYARPSVEALRAVQDALDRTRVGV
jgi:integrase